MTTIPPSGIPPTGFSRSGRRSLLICGIVLLGMALLAAADWYSALPTTATGHYVGRDSCVQCHAKQVDQWHGSHHDRAMEIPSETSVLGDFDDTSFTRFGVTTRFFRHDGKYLVNTEGPDGELHDYEIKYTFGVEPLQQYMVEFPDGRVQVLRVSWDTVKHEWFYVTPPDVIDERIEPGDPLHWTGIGQNWNTMCAECHSTNLQKNYDLATNTYQTTYSEIDVSCETCHGPASLHLELAESRSLFWDRRHGYGLAELKQAKSTEQVETCAPCHSRRSQIHADFRAGEKFLDHFDPSLLHAGLYHADGQILDEVYVYGSFLQSKMYHEGVRCTDCHNPHSLKLKFKGNRLCAQCHLPGKYDSPTHHHHTDPAGTQCINCHMVEKIYMVVDGRRDHSFRIPRPDLSEQLKTPNACNSCHTKPEESSAWAAKAVREWYGDKRRGDPHYGVAIEAGRRGAPEGVELLKDLLSRRQTPGIVRATAVELLANYPSEEIERESRKAIDDSNPLVRTAALRVFSHDLLQRFPQQVAKHLQDAIRLVRITAARRLAGEPSQLIDAEYRGPLDQALAEYRNAQEVMQERATAQLNLAAFHHALGNGQAVLKSLQTAMRLEPYLSGVRDKLASLLEQSGGDSEEIRKLRAEEANLLARDCKLLPDSTVLQYRRGMLLYLLGEYDQARQALEKACELGPEAYSNWLALALICEKQERWQQAGEALKQMNTLRPNDPAVRGILQRIQQARGEP
ncbi:MAG: tetratricopeptide repeat protein [Planctomycetes bacterium]|nr:tetratricopeptide repeat protein [Planctomycetota bacterium]